MAKRNQLVEAEQATALAEPTPEAPAAKKPRKAPGKKKVEKPVQKAAAKVSVAAGKKPGPKGTGLVGRKADLIKMGQGAFFYSLEQQRRIEEMEQVIANYERMFEAVRQLFSREMEEIEEWLAGVLE
jgi:hypothetical protein